MAKKILLVDDAEFMREMLEEMLDPSEYEIIEHVTTGREAINTYRKLMEEGNRPDIVAIDIVLPEIDGITVIREIKKLDPNAKIFVISALSAPGPINESIEAGASDYIIKPFTTKKLIKTLENLLKER
ncbi:MAG: response regulator [Candidatus Hydrothermarchaeota archaeon]